MKKKRYLIFTLLVSLVLVLGAECEKKQTGGVFLGGKEGLIVEFLEDAPPIGGNYQNEAFPIDVELINKGETDIQQNSAYIYLTGALYASNVIETTLGSDKKTVNQEFIGGITKSGDGIAEEAAIVSLGQATYKGDILGDSIPLDIKASVCYPYQTKLQIDNFCVPSTSRAVAGNEECVIDSTVNLVEANDNSGAPVQVTSLREQTGPNFVRVVLDINNVGSGEVVNACARDIQRADLNSVRLTMPNNYKCTFRDGESNTGLVELRGGHAVLRCIRDINNPGKAFKEPMTATLSYNYMQEASKSITINKAV